MLGRGCAALAAVTLLGYCTLSQLNPAPDVLPLVVGGKDLHAAIKLCKDSTKMRMTDVQDLGSMRVMIELVGPTKSAECLTQFGHIQHVSYQAKLPESKSQQHPHR